MTGSVAVSKDGLQYRFVIPGTSAVALSRSGTVFTSISPRARASESARGSATREATLRCGEPMQLRRAGATSIAGKDFLPAIALEEPVVGQGHGRFTNGAMMEQCH